MFPSCVGVHRVLISPYRSDTEIHEQDFWLFTTYQGTCKANASNPLFDITLHSHSVWSERASSLGYKLSQCQRKGSRFIHAQMCRSSGLQATCTSAEELTLKPAEAPLQAVFRLSAAAVLDMYHLELTSVGLLRKDFLEFFSTLRQALTALFHKSSESDTILEMGGRGERRENRRGVSKRENRFGGGGGLLFAFYESADFSMD